MEFHARMNAGLSLLVAGALSLALASCNTIPADALKLSPESLEKRALQTRRFEGISGDDMLAASAGLIQDLGFTIDESETGLGIIVGSKDRDATEAGQIAAATIVFLLTFVVMSTDDVQKLRASLVVRPVRDDDDMEHFVRVTFQRVVWDTEGDISQIEAIEDPEIYQGFFDKLSKAVFLEAHEI